MQLENQHYFLILILILILIQYYLCSKVKYQYQYQYQLLQVLRKQYQYVLQKYKYKSIIIIILMGIRILYLSLSINCRNYIEVPQEVCECLPTTSPPDDNCTCSGASGVQRLWSSEVRAEDIITGQRDVFRASSLHSSSSKFQTQAYWIFNITLLKY